MRRLAILASIVLVLGIAACNGGAPSQASDPSPTARAITSPTPTPLLPFGGTPTPSPTPTTPPFAIRPFPFGPDATVRSKHIDEHAGGSATFTATLSERTISQELSVTVATWRVATVRACWDSAEIGGPVPDCMREELLQPVGQPGPGRPLDLATPEAGGRA